MVIECERCHTKFRLDENLLKGTGSKVRCSICQHKFILFPPKTGLQVEEGAGEGREEPGAVPSDIDKTLVGEPIEKPEAIDETFIKEIEKELAQEEEVEPISFEDFAELDSGIIKGKAHAKDIDRAMHRAARVEEEVRAKEELEREGRGRVREAEEAYKPRPIIKKGRMSRLWITILGVVLLLAGIASVLIVFKPGFLPVSFPLGKKPISKEQAFDIGNRRLSFKDLDGSFVDSEKAGKLFMVKGFVTNNYPDRRSFIRIRSNILDSKGTVVKSKMVFAGNPISEKEVRSLSMEDIDNRLRDKFGKDKMNINVHPNDSIPFTIVFTELPEDMSEFTVEAISSSPAGK